MLKKVFSLSQWVDMFSIWLCHLEMDEDVILQVSPTVTSEALNTVNTAHVPQNMATYP